LRGHNADKEGMPAPLSIDLRERMIQAYDAKLGSQSKIAKMFHVSRKCLCDLLRLRRQTGSLAPKPHGGGRTAAYEGKVLEHLRELVGRQPDATLEELRERTGVACSLTAVHNALVRLEFHFKKNAPRQRARSA
jgi:transposase